MITRNPVCNLALVFASTLAISGAEPATGPGAGAAATKMPPKSWIDPDTGHRVIRVTDEPGSASLYFNVNGYTPDHKQMVFTTANGISVLELATFKTRPVVRENVRLVEVGRKTPTVFYTKRTPDPNITALYSTNIDTGETRQLAELPRRGGISTINADETLAAGTRIEGDGEDYGSGGAARGRGARKGAGPSLEIDQVNKHQAMAERLARRLPMELFTVDLRTGQAAGILHTTDWLGHLQFSPTDPTHLLYCHEGPWMEVDRIWTIRTDGSENTLIHTRTMEMEATGHEFWSADGKTIYYDLHLPRGRVFYLASYNLKNKQRTWYHLEVAEWSLHYNATADGTIFCGDGSDNPPAWWATPANKWIFLFRPGRIDDSAAGKAALNLDVTLFRPAGFEDSATTQSRLVHPGVLQTERLVNLAKHDYKLEPNPIFSPDNKLIFFRSNLLGPTYVFAVEVAKAGAGSAAP
jgi:oligogalacturonide lyase